VDIEALVEGGDAFHEALAAWASRMGAATEAAVEEAADTLVTTTQGNLSHAGTYRPPSARPGSPMSSEPGTPPALQSGYLRDRILKILEGEIDSGVYQARVYPSTVYARIQELGGVAGKGHRSHLPARPYFEVSIDECRGEMRSAFVAGWSKA
jgi:phage gpG-like protein